VTTDACYNLHAMERNETRRPAIMIVDDDPGVHDACGWCSKTTMT
jgi:hypothetical protein